MKVMRKQGVEQEKAIEEARVYLNTLENEIKDKKFFGGEGIGLVDIVANVIGLWVEVVQEAMGIEILSQELICIRK